MNRAEFFSVVKITRSPIVVEQTEDKFILSIVVDRGEGEPEEKYSLDAVIKSMNTVENLLREQGIYSFAVKILPEAIPKVPRKAK